MLSIAPLRYGAGVKGKVNLAMSYGLPVVATSPAVEGMHLVPGEDALVQQHRLEHTTAPRQLASEHVRAKVWVQRLGPK